MGNKQVMKDNQAKTPARTDYRKARQFTIVPKVSIVSNSIWSKMAEKVLEENMGAWKTLAKE